MTAEHFIDLDVDGDGYPVAASFTCTGDDTDTCRRWCAQGCEEVCTHPEERRPQPDGTVLAIGHRWEPVGYCNVTSWLDAYGAEDTHADEDEPYRPGRHRLHEEWDGDCYLWTYYDPEPAKATT